MPPRVSRAAPAQGLSEAGSGDTTHSDDSRSVVSTIFTALPSKAVIIAIAWPTRIPQMFFLWAADQFLQHMKLSVSSISVFPMLEEMFVRAGGA